MDADDAINAFASAGHDLPRDVMRWALDNWDDAAPGLLGVLERFADGVDRSDEAAGALFFVLHLAGEKREARAFAPLCRLARDSEAMDAVLGDGITTTLARIMIGTYDGDLDVLKSVIEAPTVNEFVRAAALETIAYLTASGRLARDETESYLRRLYDTMQPQHDSFVWSGWVMAVALLGLEALSDTVRQAFEREFVDPIVMDYDDFREDMERTLADPDPIAPFRADKLIPLDDAIGELSRWYAFSEEAKRDRERLAAGEDLELEDFEFEDLEFEGLDTAPEAPSLPAINPFKGVGRNDPCPCGSGKKFKKCCLR